MLNVQTTHIAGGGRIVGCLSMHKTGSTALSAALQSVEPADVLHAHFVGPRFLDLRRRHIATSSQEIGGLAVRIGGRSSRFHLVTCVRDPIGQMISTYFQFAANRRRTHAVETLLTNSAFFEWCDKMFPDEYSTWWFDDNLCETLDFDFRNYSFNFERKSLRFSSSKLRILCLRFEDPSDLKEIELGWLLERNPVLLPRLNVTAEKADAAAYAKFKASFVAPKCWTDRLYDGELIRHFYTPEERKAFALHWSRPRPEANNQ